MKRILLFFTVVMAAMQLFAQATYETTGTLSISAQVELNPGEDTEDPEEDEWYFTIAFDDAEQVFYTAYQMDIELPDGLEFIYPPMEDGDERPLYAELDNSDGVYPTKKFSGVYVPTHSIASAILYSQTLRVLVKHDTNTALKKHNGALLKVYVKASSYAKPGEAKINIRNIKFVTPSEDKYLYADQENLTAATISSDAKVDVKVTAANKVGTGIFPFSCALPEGLEAYTCTDDDGEYLKLEKADAIAAFTPYILYAEDGYTGTLTGTTIAADYPEAGFVNDGYLTGVLKTTEVTAGYILQNKGEGPMFYRIGSTSFSLPAGKCYCNPASSPQHAPAAFALRFGNETTVGTINAEPAANTVYDLQGRRVATPQAGNIYIINGEKVLKK